MICSSSENFESALIAVRIFRENSSFVNCILQQLESRSSFLKRSCCSCVFCIDSRARRSPTPPAQHQPGPSVGDTGTHPMPEVPFP